MAEDLSIKVKVEPDGGGVQGKLNEIAKNKKFNVEIKRHIKRVIVIIKP